MEIDGQVATFAFAITFRGKRQDLTVGFLGRRANSQRHQGRAPL